MSNIKTKEATHTHVQPSPTNPPSVMHPTTQRQVKVGGRLPPTMMEKFNTMLGNNQPPPPQPARSKTIINGKNVHQKISEKVLEKFNSMLIQPTTNPKPPEELQLLNHPPPTTPKNWLSDSKIDNKRLKKVTKSPIVKRKRVEKVRKENENRKLEMSIKSWLQNSEVKTTATVVTGMDEAGTDKSIKRDTDHLSDT